MSSQTQSVPSEPAITAPPVVHHCAELCTPSTNETPARPSPVRPRQLTAVTLLTAGQPLSAIAGILGVHRNTLHNWKKDPAFLEELHLRQTEIQSASHARLRVLFLQATHTALKSLHVKDDTERYRNSFRILTTLRPWMPTLNKLDPLDTPPL